MSDSCTRSSVGSREWMKGAGPARPRLTSSAASGAPDSDQPEKLEHSPQNALSDPGEIARFYDRCSDLMRELLDGLAAAPDTPRTFPEVEDAIGWPRRRIASVLGGVWHLRATEFGGRRPYRFFGDDSSASGRWEIWCDAAQASAIQDARRSQV